MKQLWKNVVSTAGDILFGMKTCYLASRRYCTLKYMVLFLTTFGPLITMRLWREIFNGLADGTDMRTVGVCLAAYLLLTYVSYLLAQLDEYVSKRYGEELNFYIDDILIEKTSRMDLAFFDSASMSDKIRNARQNFDSINDVTWLAFNIVSEIISIVAISAIVCAYKWWLGPAVIILLIPYMVINKRHTDDMLALQKAQLRDKRKMDYYSEVFNNADIQFEIKLNGIGDFFLDRYKRISRGLEYQDLREQKRYSARNILTSVLNILGDLLVLALSAADVLASRIGIGDLHYNLSMVSRLRSQSAALMTDMNKFFLDSKRLRELREFIAITPVTEKGGDKIPSSNPQIVFSHVSFRYPNSESYVLRDCSFVIEPQEKVGLLGLNGAGKTTIIKLMFRFYDPQEGEILLDGINIKEYDIYAVRRIFGVMFQDYVPYSLPLRELIALSDFSGRTNEERLRRACDLSGFSHIMVDWKDSFDSVLGRYYAKGGRDLSGGQWQLLSLARAYFRQCEYMILDEPSAALDPISEDRIFEQLYHLSENKTAVMISHRLSNTVLADKILVIRDGHIIEQGSHRELLKQGGEYAHLFQLQAKQYL